MLLKNIVFKGHLFKDNFYKTLLWMAIPIAIQTLLFSSKAFIDTFLLAQVSSDDVSATGIIGRVMLVAIITIMGISTGGGYVAAQCSKDDKKLNSAIVTTLLISIAVALIIFFAITAFDIRIINMFTTDSNIISLCQSYLSIVLVSLLLLSMSSVIASYLRIVEQSTWVSAVISIGVLLNILLSSILIHQYQLGIAGAAYGTVMGALFEFIALVFLLFYKRMNICQGVTFNKQQFLTIKEQIITSTSSSLVWSLGAFLFYSFLGRSSHDALHAISIIIPIESILLSLSLGISVATSILIGKAIPHESKAQIYQKSKASIMLCLYSIMVIVVIFALFKNEIIGYFSQDNGTYALNSYITLMMIGVVIKSVSIQTMNGIIRSGGDGRFCMKLDIIMQWLIILPTSYIMLLLGYNPLYIYLLVLFEELLKVFASLYRFKSDKWRHNLCQA